MKSISTLIGKKVTVYTRMGEVEKQDVGILEGLEQDWLILHKSDGDTLFFCLYNVRLVKPFEQL